MFVSTNGTKICFWDIMSVDPTLSLVQRQLWVLNTLIRAYAVE
jgi:hypothetical protein